MKRILIEKKGWMIVFCILPVIFLLIGGPSRAIAQNTIKIGVLECFRGTSEYFSREWYNSVKFAVEERNEKGGLLGKKIELIPVDHEMKPEIAVRKAKKLLLEDKVEFLFVGMASHICIALNKIAPTYKKIFLYYGGVADSITGSEFSRYAFRATINSHTFSLGVAKYMSSKPFRRYYFLNPDYAMGHDIARTFKENLKVYVPEAKIVGEDYHPLGTKEYAPYIEKVVASHADAIFTGTFGTDFIYLMKQARSLGLKSPFPFVTYVNPDPILMEQLKEDAVGMTSVHIYSMAVDTPENKRFVARFHEKNKDNKNPCERWPRESGAIPALAVPMLFAAVEKANSLDTEKIIEAFEGFWYKTPVGWWEMRKCDHTLVAPLYSSEVVSGPNPYYDHPWLGPNVYKVDGMEASIPPTSKYNPRCY